MPLAAALHHSTQEVKNFLDTYNNTLERIKKLAPAKLYQQKDNTHLKTYTLSNWIKAAGDQKAYVMLGLHGGIGENGYIQNLLQSNTVPFNGSNSLTCQICMDKYETGVIVNNIGDPPLTLPQK